MEAKTRGLKESRQVNNGSVHGQDQYRVWHVIAVCFRTGQDMSKSWAAQIQAGTRKGHDQGQCKAGQVEPTRDTLEPDLGNGTVQAYELVRDAKKHPEAKTGDQYHIAERSGGTSIKSGIILILFTARGPTPNADSFDCIP